MTIRVEPWVPIRDRIDLTKPYVERFCESTFLEKLKVLIPIKRPPPKSTAQILEDELLRSSAYNLRGKNPPA